MTDAPNIPQLAILTLRNPAAAAEIVLAWSLPKEALWTAIALVSVIVTMLSTLSNMIFPVPAPLNGIVGNPFVYFLIVVGGFVATVHAIYWTGRTLGGQGSLEGMMSLLLWVQALRAAAQVAVLMTLIIAPVLASFFVLFVAVATIWIFVHFINVGLQLHSIMRSVAVLVVAAIALVAGLTFFLSLIGVTVVGVPVDV